LAYQNPFTYKELEGIPSVETEGLELSHPSAQTEACKIKKEIFFSEKKVFSRK